MLKRWTKLCLLFSLLFCGNLVVSQTDSTYHQALLDKADQFLDRNVDSALYYARILQTKELAPAQQLRSLNLFGNCMQRKGKVDSAMIYYQKVETLAKDLNDDKGMAIVLNNIGIIHTNKGEYDQALASYFEAIEYEMKVNDSTGIAEGYNNVGVVHYYMGDMQNTLKYLKKSAEITKAIGDQRVLKKAYINIGAIHRYNKEYAEAIQFYEQGLEISKELNDQSDAIICFHNLADVYALQERYTKAEEYYRKAMDFHQQFENPRGIALEYNNLGSMYKQQGKLLKAEGFFKQAIELADKGKYFNVSESAYSGLMDLYAQQGKYKRAYDASRELQSRKDSVFTLEKAKNVDELRTKYETAENERMLAVEKSRSDSLTAINAVIEKEKAKAELETANRNQWILGLSAFLALSLIIFWAIVQRQKLKAQTERDAAIIEERDKGIQAVFNAQEEERKRISKDLHDGIGQQLSALKMAFQRLKPKLQTADSELNTDLDKLSGILDQSAKDIRTISHQMMPRTLTELGLLQAVEDLLSKSMEPTGIQYELESFGMEERLESKLEVALYRIIQELLNNIIKHAEASHVMIQLIKRNNRILLLVEDNGIGIQKDESGGHGLLNIKSRLNPMNGEISIEPSPKSGTLATVRIPIIDNKTYF